MRFGVRLPGPFFATFGRTARGQARRNLAVRAHERDILAGNRTAGEEFGLSMRAMFGILILLSVAAVPFYVAWIGIAHVANDINPDLHWHQTYRAVANCNVTMGFDVAPIGDHCATGTYEPVGWHY